MTVGRQTVALYGLPIATLMLAAILQLGVAPAEHAAVPVRIVLSLLAIGLVFATIFVALHHAEAIAHQFGFGTGRTTVLTGLVHLMIFSAHVFLIFFP